MDGRPLKRIFIDGGAAVNVLPISTLAKIGKSRSDMVPTQTTISSFAGDESVPMGCLVLDVTVGSVVTPTLFFIMGTKATYQALLGRCWIHSARCLPSTLHRKLWIWNKDGEVEEIDGLQPPMQVGAILTGETDPYGEDIRPFLAIAGDRHSRLIGCSWSKQGYELLFEDGPRADDADKEEVSR